MKNWIPVTDRLPGIPPNWLRCSENVKIMLNSGEIITGFYVAEWDVWYDYNTAKKVPNKLVVAWQSIKK